ncbi:MAG: sodium/glutamate symporter [gamma proteobacterium symbiont of Taylorina sp.]|nr:sodium/glutamate symporter [gamma proteobacterium symbiont of Taylorina sp.]
MEFIENTLAFQSFFTVTLAILVLFIGKGLNLRYAVLRDFNIPEPVVGGLLFSIIFAIVHFSIGITIEFDLAARDIMLVYFFTTIGLNSNVMDLVKGGKPLIVLLFATALYMVIQNVVGISVASLFGLEPVVGMLGGTVSLIGGHGTAIAWAPTFAEKFGIHNAMEIAIACATFGLILASLMGGPIASFLIKKHNLTTNQSDNLDVGIAYDDKNAKIDYFSFLHAVLAIHISVIIGLFLNELLEEAGLKLPLFVTCLFAGILISSFITPKAAKKFTWLDWKAKNTAMALIADISLGIFLAMSLMSMQLWVILELAGPILAIITAQFVVAISVTLFVIYNIMGRSYDAAVVCSGFGGISLGSTATAMANMTAVTQRYGPSHLAFVIVPLVCAFFVDLINVVLIQSLISYFS